MFDNNFIDQLPQDPLEAAEKICRAFREFDGLADPNRLSLYEDYVKIYSLMAAFLRVSGFLSDHPPIPLLTESPERNVLSIRAFFDHVDSVVLSQKTDRIEDHYLSVIQSKFGKGFIYEFSEGDFKRIQELLNELREVISGSQYIEEDHRSRLLRRLEKLQAELHKKLSDLDRFWGLIGEAGVVAGKFGSDVKPIVDLIKEITSIVWRTQSWAEGLPTNIPPPLIEPKEPDKK